MVKSDLCWMKDEKGDCDFDHGGYFIVKGAEKVGLEITFNFSFILHLFMTAICFAKAHFQMIDTMKISNSISV